MLQTANPREPIETDRSVPSPMGDGAPVEPLPHNIDLIPLKFDRCPLAGSSGGTAFLQIPHQQFYI